MGESLARRWKAVRELREQWGVPFDLLDRVMGRVAGTIARRAEKEIWQDSAANHASDAYYQQLAGRSSGVLHRQLVDAFQEQLARFQTEDQSGDAEKRARALSILAKTLETLAEIGMKLDTYGNQGAGLENGQPVGSLSGPQASETQELDRQLTALIGNLVRDGENTDPFGDGDTAKGTSG
ncbi:MAG: hypothetical protein ACR2O8_09085 [Rhizobiaceae bacterium]